MRFFTLILLYTCLVAPTTSLADDPLTLEAMPPVVVKTTPQAGDAAVNPSVTEIKVTFSKDMRDGTWSWSTVTQDSFPPLAGKPKYIDESTCVLPVKLEPEKTYGLWLNSTKFKNFKDASGIPAVPYLLVFRTSK